ncbi:hypothetical protein P8452_53507 [Trifolium repens]|nr:hypothetical protein P8452_53507 [Trifolium repens]
MAYKASFFIALILINNILLNTTCQARDIVPKNSNTDDKKEPQWFFHFDGIPDFGRMFPPWFGYTPQNPSNGAGTGEGDDDTFVPNPGVEVPNPDSGGAVPIPATVHP